MSKEELEWYEHYMRQDKEELVDMIMTRNGNIENYKRQIKELQQRMDKAIKILDNFDAWLEPQDTLKIRKCIEILKGGNNE